jgi:hypothetical protein
MPDIEIIQPNKLLQLVNTSILNASVSITEARSQVIFRQPVFVKTKRNNWSL